MLMPEKSWADYVWSVDPVLIPQADAGASAFTVMREQLGLTLGLKFGTDEGLCGRTL